KGDYHLPNLDAGTYVLRFEISGFAVQSSEAELLARQTIRVDARLAIATGSESVEVRAASSVIETDSTTVSSSKSGADISSLALNFRATSDTSPLVVAALTPAVQQDGSGNISVAGLQPAMTQFSIDGISTERTRGGGGPGAQPRDLFPSVESMEEFKVNTAGNNAEYLQATDITTTSKSGTNALHGTLYGFLQDSALGATDPFAASKPSVKGKTFGATLGGPVVSNRTFFFVSYEGVRRPQDIPISQVVPPDAYRSGDLSSVGTPIVDPATGQPFPG